MPRDSGPASPGAKAGARTGHPDFQVQGAYVLIGFLVTIISGVVVGLLLIH